MLITSTWSRCLALVMLFSALVLYTSAATPAEEVRSGYRAHERRMTNAERLARGLPPNKPKRRFDALRGELLLYVLSMSSVMSMNSLLTSDTVDHSAPGNTQRHSSASASVVPPNRRDQSCHLQRPDPPLRILAHRGRAPVLRKPGSDDRQSLRRHLVDSALPRLRLPWVVAVCGE